MAEFQLGEHPFITLNNLLKVMRWVSTGGEANIAISNGLVLVNGQLETQKRKKLYPGDQVIFQKHKVKVAAS
jgi:ribosome-associated protein